MEDSEQETPKRGVDYDSFRVLRHDINNQLSNILLALEQLRYEIPEVTEDIVFYIELISVSSSRITTLLREADEI